MQDTSGLRLVGRRGEQDVSSFDGHTRRVPSRTPETESPPWGKVRTWGCHPPRVSEDPDGGFALSEGREGVASGRHDRSRYD